MSWLRSMPFQYRLLLGCLLVAMLPLILGNLVIVRVFEASMETQSAELAGRQIAEMERQLDEFFRGCEDISGQVAESGFYAWALIDNTGSLESDVYLALYKAGSTLRPGTDLSLYDAGGRLRFTTNSATAYATLPVRWGALRKASQTDGIVYYDIESFSAASVYAMRTAQCLYGSEGAMMGYVVISATPDTFQSLFAGLYPEQGSLLLLDPVGNVVFSSHSALDEWELDLIRDGIKSGGEVSEQGNYHYYTARDGRSGFYLVLRQPKPFSGSAIGTMRSIGLAAAALGFVLCLLFSAAVSRSLSMPIRQLSKAMARVQQGKLDTRVETKWRDELGQLTQSFNQMTGDLGLYMDKTLQQQREMNESQIRLMQAQLNPHFLYNTLDTVKWLARIHDVPEISSIASSLAVILRQYASGERFVTLRQELDMVQGYIDIQRIRFSGRFQYVVNVPSSMEDCILPKLILQPLVENAIVHGLAEQDDGLIYIYAGYLEDGDLYLSVTDDGCGMSPEVIKSLERVDDTLSGNHLGLRNVNGIIKMHYGMQYGLRAHAIAGVGTTVTIHLPEQRRESVD